MSNYANRQPAVRPPVQRSERTGNSVIANPQIASTPSVQNAQRAISNKFTRNQANQNNTAIQAKLQVGSAFDPAEAEADNAAKEVVHQKSGSKVSSGSPPKPLVNRISRKMQRSETGEGEDAQLKLQREELDESAQMKVQRAEDDEDPSPADIKQEENNVVQRQEDEGVQLKRQRSDGEASQKKRNRSKRNHKNGFTASQNTADQIDARKPLGEKMPADLRNEMEDGFGADFSDVKIHRDDASAKLNHDLKAKAFTTGQHVFFGAGQFDDKTDKGKELIAHELTHTIQQGAVKGKNPSAAKKKKSKKKRSKSSKGSGDQRKGLSILGINLSKPSGRKKNKSSKHKGKDESAEPITPKAPQSPEEDLAFQEVLAQIAMTASAQKVHPDAGDKAAEVEEATALPEADQAFENDAKSHMAGMDEESEKKQREPFTAAKFKEKLKQNLEDLEKNLPKSEEDAEEFKKNDEISNIKDGISNDVKASQSEVTGGLEGSAKQGTPPATGLPTKKGKPLKKDRSGKRPAGINPEAAVPKPKTDEEISMEAESKDLDVLMEENDVSDSQLANSNEPKFTKGLAKKQKAQKKAAEAPAEYRKQEDEKLQGARLLANESTKTGFKEMFGAQKGALGGVNSKQAQTEKSDEQMQAEINAKFQEIYTETKNKVTTTLETLSNTVDNYFEKEAEAAKKTFEDNVDDKISEIYGWTVIDDWLFGADTEAIERVFVEEKQIFIDTMDGILDKIAEGIATTLNETLAIIKEGRRKTTEFYEGLTDRQKKLGEDAYADYKDQYNELEDSVYEKEDELASGLADSYKENVDSLRETFETIRDTVAAGWIGAAFMAIWNIIKTILNLFKMLLDLLFAAVEAIGAILSDPIGFLTNLFRGVQEGLNNFVTNIKTHLVTGLVEWLTGSLGGVGITLPEDIFSLSGIFSLAGQVLGLSWDFFRAKAVRKLGEPIVQGIEASIDIFIIIKNEGLDGLWKFISEKFQDLKTTVMDAIQDMIITKVVEAGIKWMLSLLNPASAFVKAVMMIIDVARFFIERAADIIELVTAFIDGIRAIGRGDVGGVARGIEKALAKAIPILLGFLASLLGITGLTKKVTKIIRKIKGKVDRAINKLINKAFGMFKKKGGKGKKGKKGEKGEEDVKGLTAKDKKKHKKYVGEIEKALKKPAKKKPKTFEEFYKQKKKQAKSLEKKYNKKIKKKVKGKPIKTKITMGTLAAEKKDNDLDMKIKIAPNDANGKVVLPMEETSIPKAEITPGFNSNKASTITAKYLANVPGNHEHGTDAVVYTRKKGNTLGGALSLLEDMGIRSKWVAFHLINEQVGGKATASNLTPTHRNDNMDYKDDFEKRQKNNFFNGDPPNPIWWQADVSYRDEVFPKVVKAKGGKMKVDPNSKKWVIDKRDIKSWSATIREPNPETLKINKLALWNKPWQQKWLKKTLGNSGMKESLFEKFKPFTPLRSKAEMVDLVDSWNMSKSNNTAMKTQIDNTKINFE